MQTSLRSRGFASCGLVLLATVGLSAEPVVDDHAVLPAIEQLVKAAFPELGQRGLTVDISAQTVYDHSWSQVFLVTMRIPDPVERGTDPLAQADKALLTGTFDMTDGVIQRAVFWGKELRTDEGRALKKTFESRKKWSDADLRSAMNEAGANYGPSDQAAFDRQLPLDRLEPIVGRITSKDVSFSWGTRSNNVDLPDDILATWVVDLETSKNQKVGCYRLTFDPLTGRMTSFSLRECH